MQGRHLNVGGRRRHPIPATEVEVTVGGALAEAAFFELHGQVDNSTPLFEPKLVRVPANNTEQLKHREH